MSLVDVINTVSAVAIVVLSARIYCSRRRIDRLTQELQERLDERA